MQHSRTKNYIRGLASGYVVTFATMVVGLWMTPFTLHFLDREQFAIFTLASDVLMWLGLIDLGFVAVLSVRAAQITGKPDQQELNTLASTTFFAQLAVAATILAVGVIVTLYFPDFFALRTDLRQDAISVMVLLVVGAAISVGTQTFSVLLVAHQQIHIDNLLRLGLIFIRTGLTVGLLMAGYGLLSLAWANLAATVITSLLAVYRVRKYLTGLSIQRRHFCWDILRQSSGTGIWFSLGGIAGLLIMNLDRIVTAKIISVEMVTTLALTGRLYVLAWGLIQQLTNTARPALAQIVGKGDMEHAKAKFHQLSLLSTGIAIIAAASIWAGNGAFVTWWVGHQNYGGTALDACLAINLVVNAWILPNRAILSAGLIVKPQTLSRIAEGCINLALSVVLGFRFGLVGIAISTAIAGFLTSFWYLPFLTSRMLAYPFKQFLRLNISFLFLLVLIIPVVWLLKSTFAGSTGFLPAISMMAATGIAGLSLMWLMVLDKATRGSLIKLITRYA